MSLKEKVIYKDSSTTSIGNPPETLSSIDEDMIQAKLEEALSKEFPFIEEGTIVKGKVVAIESDAVLVDIGFKSEGMVPISQFERTSEGELSVKVGDEIDVYIVKREGEDGLTLLSKNLAQIMRSWQILNEAYSSATALEAVVTSVTKGGWIVKILGLSGFVPLSQTGLSPEEKMEDYLNKEIMVKVISLDEKTNKLILSRRQALEEERTKKKKEFIANLKEGEIVEGIVKSVTSYGAFIDLGGADGLLHISDMSWGKVTNPEEIVKVGEKIKVMVLKCEPELLRVSLGLKQMLPDPWLSVPEKYPVGSIVEGTVVGLTDYGVFVQLEDGVDGMVHVSEIPSIKKGIKPAELFKLGDRLTLKVLSIDTVQRRISFTMRLEEEEKWKEIEKQYPVGKVVRGKVVGIRDYGLFLQLEDDVEGLIHKSDISWLKPIKHPSEMFKIGDVIEARVLKVNTKLKKIKLGIKQLTPDPYLSFIKKYKPGDIVIGKVTAITGQGLEVELEYGIEGICKIPTTSTEKGKDKLKEIKVGDEMKFRILRFNRVKRTVSLAQYESILEKEIMESSSRSKKK